MIYYVLPIYNEADNLEKLFHKLHDISQENHLEYTIVAVDDGSQDSSPSTLARLSSTYPTIILTHSQNKGPGIAFRTGLDHVLAMAHSEDKIITMDADNTHSTKTIAMMNTCLDEGIEMVIASVFAPGGMLIGVPFLRYVLTWTCNVLYRILYPVRGIKEYTGFYRAYQVGMLRKAKNQWKGHLISASGFAAMAELLIRLRTIPVIMKEVPMVVRYDQKGGKSKLRIWRTIWEHLKVLGRNFFYRRLW